MADQRQLDFIYICNISRQYHTVCFLKAAIINDNALSITDKYLTERKQSASQIGFFELSFYLLKKRTSAIIKYNTKLEAA